MTPKAPTDRELFFQSLALFDRPDQKGRQKERVFEDDVDIDAYIDRALANATMPPG